MTGIWDSAPCTAVVYDWIKCFEGREQLEEGPKKWKPSISKSHENEQACAESS